MEERLQKILAKAGLGSRRACEELIEKGRVTVNGKRAELGQKADPAHDRIRVDGSRLPQPERLVYVALNKPRGVVASLAAQDQRQTLSDLAPRTERLYPVGRLDVDSEGLILLTNDGPLANRLTHPRYGHEKEYRVLVEGEVDERRLQAWRRGVVLEDGWKSAPADIVREREQRAGKASNVKRKTSNVKRKTSNARSDASNVKHETSNVKGEWLRITMREGRKHQIRVIGAHLGLRVLRIVRTRIGTLKLGDLLPGRHRELAAWEVERLKSPSIPQSSQRARSRTSNVKRETSQLPWTHVPGNVKRKT